ncbi:hypothetical protein N7509_000217 [Penicillium cosmopolitanum]|uniref:Uncharacterized protein n=1 Tax=Penicillium cosmopolitanum TaxID=1131564 RepID=A0A9W9WCW2_9EURO|nr:uncharacterized protein N7509_000217 [Penicillium cosmopolitanum]KAJ5414883.1 hypothetical protein N7509_000217 [Penicillium cosmopolitanum]
MSIEFTSNNHYLQVGTNHGNINVFTEPRSAGHSEDTLDSKVGGSIDAATRRALDQALVNIQRYLDIAQRDVSLHSRIIGMMAHIGSLLLNIKELKPEQWGSLGSEVVSNVFSLLYCCTIDCRELFSTPLTSSPSYDGLTACHLALQCVYGAALMYVSGFSFGAYSISYLTRLAF